MKDTNGHDLPDPVSGASDAIWKFVLYVVIALVVLALVLWIVRKLMLRKEPPEDHSLHLP